MQTDSYTQTLSELAHQKHQEFLERGDLIALALTGSFARNTTWQGSDLDFWGFAKDETEEFLDGTDNNIYWEIDIVPSAYLDVSIDENTWLSPPSFHTFDNVTLLEALSGCKVLYDPTGKLTHIKQAIESRISNREWLQKRAALFLSYAQGALDGLRFADPIPAILYTREIATNYIIAAHWMNQGQLLNSTIRIPERLQTWQEIHQSYCDIFALNGKIALEEFLQNYAQLPKIVQEDTHSDLHNEALPAAQLGMLDGALRYLRFTMAIQALELGLVEEVRPCLAIKEDVITHREEIIEQCQNLIEQVKNASKG